MRLFSLYMGLNKHVGYHFVVSDAPEYFTFFTLEPTPVRISDKVPNIEVCPCDRYPAIKPNVPAANMPVPIININCPPSAPTPLTGTRKGGRSISVLALGQSEDEGGRRAEVRMGAVHQSGTF